MEIKTVINLPEERLFTNIILITSDKNKIKKTLRGIFGLFGMWRYFEFNEDEIYASLTNTGILEVECGQKTINTGMISSFRIELYPEINEGRLKYRRASMIFVDEELYFKKPVENRIELESDIFSVIVELPKFMKVIDSEKPYFLI